MTVTHTDTPVQADPLAGISTRCHRLLLTGAGGNLGKVLRERLPKYADVLRISDISDLGAARKGEEVIPCNLADPHAVDALVAGTDAIVHLGGISVERPFEEILPANIQGVYNLYEAARRHGVRTSKSSAICSTRCRSPPAEKPLPSPRMSATRTEGSADTSRQISASSRCKLASAVDSLRLADCAAPITISRMGPC